MSQIHEVFPYLMVRDAKAAIVFYQRAFGATELFRPRAVPIVRYRYRGARIPTPWTSGQPGAPAPAT